MRLAVFGTPVAQSLSPFIHQQFARQCGLSVDYRAVETHHRDFPVRLHELAAAGGRGCNVTVPLKHDAWEVAARCSPSAGRAQAANTVVLEPDGSWYGDNTDGRGLVRDLARCLGPLSGRSILILGAGGAAAGILGDLLEQGPGEVCISNRTLERAEKLAARHADQARVRACELGALAGCGTFDLVIHATSAGHSGRRTTLPAGLISPSGLCYDLNYGAAAEPLQQACAAAGVAYQDGLGMLVEQAALSFALWSGLQPEVAPVLRQLRETTPPGKL